MKKDMLQYIKVKTPKNKGYHAEDVIASATEVKATLTGRNFYFTEFSGTIPKLAPEFVDLPNTLIVQN